MKRLIFLTLSTLCAASFAQVPDYVPTEGLLGWWPFAGDAQDQSGNGHDGMVDGAGLTTDRFENADAAYFFDGIDDLIQTDIAFSQLSNSAGLSGAAWIKLGPGESYFGHTIISNHAPSNTQFWFGLVGSESEEDKAKLAVGYKATNAVFQVKTCSTHPIEVGTWTHVGFSISTDFVRFYVNGQLLDEQISNFVALGQESENVPDVKMGQGNPTNGFRQDFNGSMDEMGLWTRALADEEVQALYNGEGLSQSIRLDGGDDYVFLNSTMSSDNFTLSMDVYVQSLSSSGDYLFDGRLDDERGYFLLLQENGSVDFGWENGVGQFVYQQVELDDVNWIANWNRITLFQSGQSLQLYVGDELRGEVLGFMDVLEEREGIFIGRRNNGTGHDLEGYIDNILLASNAVRPEQLRFLMCGGFASELAQAFWSFEDGMLLAQGTNSSATLSLENGSELDDLDSGWNCGFPFCGDGTVWNEELGGCVVAEPAYLNEPGEEAVLNPCYFDSNDDGLVNVSDLMNLLTVFNLACGEIPETTASWQCGDPLEYQGYDYATVQIGEQCWFAENLRAENYRNGDEILSDVIGSQWQYLTEGACAVYGESDGCEAADFYSACDPIESLNAFGRLYNWYAVNNIHGICPSAWHVPTDVEWDVLDEAMGGGNLTDEALKATFGWNSDNGTNASGFSAIPSGKRDVPGGDFIAAGDTGGWWSSTENGAYAWTRLLNTTASELVRYGPNKKDGFSIRCIKDAE